VVSGVLAGLFGVMLGVSAVAVPDVGVVTCLLVVTGGMLVMISGFQVVLFTFFRHGFLFLRYRSRVENTPGL
jgi:hypothetical protein